MFEQEQDQINKLKLIQNHNESAASGVASAAIKSKTKVEIEEIRQQFTEYEKRDIPF